MGSEQERIARLASVFGQPPAPSFGIGDDCAVLPGVADVVVTVDTAVEGVHFNRDFLTLDAASERAVETALSDVAAMGARVDVPGAGLLLAWTLPPGLPEADMDALATGAARAAVRAGTWIVGGNLAAAPVLSLTTTVVARATGRVLTRGGARPGDVVAVSGVVGAASLGLRALVAGRGDDIDAVEYVTRWRSPRARLEQGRAALGWATAMIDVSDGLAQDVGHIARASSVAVLLDADALPMIPGQRAFAAMFGADAVEVALAGGEDYELVAMGPRADVPVGWTVIGEVTRGDGVRVRQAGRIRSVPRGWDHFG